MTFTQTPEVWEEVTYEGQRKELWPSNRICTETGGRLVGLKWGDISVGGKKEVWNEIGNQTKVRAPLLEGFGALFSALLSASGKS